MNHPIAGRSPGQAQETHEFQFRNPTVPGGWLELLCSGKISRSEFLLTIIVDAYIKRDGPGCFATNGYLGRKLGMTAHGVSQCIRKLVQRDLMIRYFKDGKRYLEAYWSRKLDPPESATPPGTARATPPGTARATRSSLATQESIRKPKGKPEPGFPVPKRPNRSSPKSRTKEPAMPFVEESRSGKSSRTVDADHERSQRLREHSARRGWFISRSPKRWADALGRLRRQLGADAGQIDAVLDWYFDSGIDRPKIRDGADLLRCWSWLSDLKEKSERKNPSVTVSDSARKICERLDDYIWPKGSAAQLPVAVQITLNNITALHKKIDAFIKKNHVPDESRRGVWKYSKTDLLVQFAVYVKHSLLSSPDHFAFEWFRSRNERLHRWRDWSGDMMSIAFRADHPDFVRSGTETADRWNHKPETWKQLMKELENG